MKIAIGNDHAAVELKIIIMEYLKGKGHEIINCGTDTGDSTDYPLYSKAVCEKVTNKEADSGILICGTGVGMAITANKFHGIKAVVCSEPYSAKLSKEHNNTNVLSLGSRVVGSELAKMIVDTWMEADYEGGRHQKRIDLINDFESEY